MIALPFNFQPESVAVKTSSYDIPAGQYAYVTFNVRAGGTGTIDGSTAVDAISNTSPDVIAVSVTSSIGSTATYAVPTDYKFEGICTVVGTAGAVSIGGTQVGLADTALTAATTRTYYAGGGDTVLIAAQSGAYQTITGYAKKEGAPHDPTVASFWVPTGTTISGSSTWYATVALFNELT